MPRQAKYASATPAVKWHDPIQYMPLSFTGKQNKHKNQDIGSTSTAHKHKIVELVEFNAELSTIQERNQY